jgi:hypothetical protein
MGTQGKSDFFRMNSRIGLAQRMTYQLVPIESGPSVATLEGSCLPTENLSIAIRKLEILSKVRCVAFSSLLSVPHSARLNWDVYVTPATPIVTSDKPLGVRDTFGQAIASTQDLYNKMLELYPNRVNPAWALWSSARAVMSGAAVP